MLGVLFPAARSGETPLIYNMRCGTVGMEAYAKTCSSSIGKRTMSVQPLTAPALLTYASRCSYPMCRSFPIRRLCMQRGSASCRLTRVRQFHRRRALLRHSGERR